MEFVLDFMKCILVIINDFIFYDIYNIGIFYFILGFFLYSG